MVPLTGAIKSLFGQVLGNPVIGRELKVRVRFARSYWLQGGYLLFLLLIIGYAYIEAFERVSRNPYTAQSHLQEFYHILFITLTTLIALIVPALTAAAITMERERKTIDLLLATPLKARDLMVGKLVASFAFLGLLLALSMPASAVCVLLGGATIAEVLGTYVILAFDGLLLAALALACSSLNRQSGRAVFWAYLLVAAFLLATVLPGVLALESGTLSRGTMGVLSCLVPVGTLNPFFAPYLAGTITPLFAWKIPTWVMGALYALLLTRLVLTSTAHRVGLYDRDTLPALRRQVLFLTAFILLTSLGALTPVIRTAFTSALFASQPMIFEVAFSASLLPVTFFILLFVPWLSTFGRQQDKRVEDDGWFHPLRLFRRSPAGALPFLYAWLGTAAATILITLWGIAGKMFHTDAVGSTLLYSIGLLTFFWAIGRLCSVFTSDLLTARVVMIILSVVVVVLPFSLAVQAEGFENLHHTEVFKWWVFAPLFDWVAWIDPGGGVFPTAFAKYGWWLLRASGGVCLLAWLPSFGKRRGQGKGWVFVSGGNRNGYGSDRTV